MALLMKGKSKVDELRTIPLLTCAFETLQKKWILLSSIQ
jgi:hypothetical protein